MAVSVPPTGGEREYPTPLDMGLGAEFFRPYRRPCGDGARCQCLRDSGFLFSASSATEVAE